MEPCTHPEHVYWNAGNKVVQCHACGHVWIASPPPGEPYSAYPEVVLVTAFGTFGHPPLPPQPVSDFVSGSAGERMKIADSPTARRAGR